jgi:outer membrane protein TolC
VLAVAVAHGQEQIVQISLQQAIEMAKSKNYTLENARLDQKLAEKKVAEIRAVGLPQINAAGSFVDNIDIPTQVLPNFLKPTLVAANPASASAIPDVISAQFGQPYTATGSITASQLLFDGTYFLGLKAAREYVNLARLGVKRTQVEIESAITRMYFAVLLTKANVDMLDNTLVTLNKTLAEVREVYKSGLSEKLDLDRLELNASGTKIQRDKIADQNLIALMVLKVQLGMSPSDSLVLTDELEKLYTSTLIAPAESKADYAKRPEYQMLEQSMKLQVMDRKRYQYGYAPSLGAFLTHQRNTFGTEFGDLGKTWYPGTVLGVNLSLPIFDGFRKSALIQQSRLNLMKIGNEKKLLENNIDQEVKQARLKFDRARQQLDMQKRNMDLSREIYDRANIKYKAGLGSSLELTTAENEMKMAQTTYLNSIYDLLVAQTDLRKALGLIN